MIRLLPRVALGSIANIPSATSDYSLDGGLRLGFRVTTNSDTSSGHGFGYGYSRPQLVFDSAGGQRQGMAIHQGTYMRLAKARGFAPSLPGAYNFRTWYPRCLCRPRRWYDQVWAQLWRRAKKSRQSHFSNPLRSASGRNSQAVPSVQPLGLAPAKRVFDWLLVRAVRSTEGESRKDPLRCAEAWSGRKPPELAVPPEIGRDNRAAISAKSPHTTGRWGPDRHR